MILLSLIYCCLLLRSFTKADAPITRKNLPNVGSAVQLGELYDATRDVLLISNLYTKETIEEKSTELKTVYSNTRFLVEESYLDRINALDVDLSLELSLMGGFIEISGSANYLQNTELTENMVSTTLQFQSTSLTKRLPYGLSPDNGNLCNKVGQEGVEKPTHVVSEIVYGLNAFMQFSINTRNQTDQKEIGGSLRVMINSIPGLKINADGSVNMTENEEKISRNMKLDFYGDTLIDSPTTFESAVKVYKDLPTFANTSESVVRFSLSPITDYCTGTTTILNQISGDNVKKVTAMLGDFYLIKTKLRTLMATDVATQYPNYKTMLTTVQTKVESFENDIKGELQRVLPNIRGGGGKSEVELTSIVERYQSSAFNLFNLDLFFDARRREIGTVSNVLNAADKSKKVTVDFGRSAEGNKCIQDNDRAVIYIMRVLPLKTVADDFLSTSPGQWNEKTKWFFNASEVQKAGYKLKQMLELHDNNPDENTCYLIKLDFQDVTKPATELRILEEGETKARDFVPPSLIEKNDIREMRGYDSDPARGCYYEINIKWQKPNQFIKKIRAKLWNKSLGEVKENAQTRYQAVDAMSTEANFMLNLLEPYSQYGVTLTFVTDYGIGPESEEITITTLPSSPPSMVKVKSRTPTSFEISWKEPLEIGTSVNLDTVQYKVTKDEIEVYPGGEISGNDFPTSINLEGLEPAENYLFHVQAKSSESLNISFSRNGLPIPTSIGSEWAVLPLTTMPPQLETPTLETKTENSVTLSWQPFSKIAAGASFINYSIRSKKFNAEDWEYVTSQTHRSTLGGLQAGEKYLIQVNTVTSKGDSPYSGSMVVTTNEMTQTLTQKMKNDLGINTLSDRLNKVELKNSVWFDAVRKSEFNDATGNGYYKTITYTDVRESTYKSGAMDKETGVFTAPLAGTYQFFIQTYKPFSVYGWVRIVVDGTTVSYIYDGNQSNRATITGTAIIEMQPGQKVWAETYYKIFSNSDGYIHFTGVLITPK